MIVMTVLMGIVYPLTMTGIGLLVFPHQANGSLIHAENDTIIGSELITQPVKDLKYFRPRPSAGNYATMPSGASNLPTTSQSLYNTVGERKALVLQENNLAADTFVPSELLFASGSGLDPHISIDSALLQASRVARERNLTVQEVQDLIKENTDKGGIFGTDLVNVLTLNLALDKRH